MGACGRSEDWCSPPSLPSSLRQAALSGSHGIAGAAWRQTRSIRAIQCRLRWAAASKLNSVRSVTARSSRASRTGGRAGPMEDCLRRPATFRDTLGNTGTRCCSGSPGRVPRQLSEAATRATCRASEVSCQTPTSGQRSLSSRAPGLIASAACKNARATSKGSRRDNLTKAPGG